MTGRGEEKRVIEEDIAIKGLTISGECFILNVSAYRGDYRKKNIENGRKYNEQT